AVGLHDHIGADVHAPRALQAAREHDKAARADRTDAERARIEEEGDRLEEVHGGVVMSRGPSPIAAAVGRGAWIARIRLPKARAAIQKGNAKGFGRTRIGSMSTQYAPVRRSGSSALRMSSLANARALPKRASHRRHG